MEHTSPAPHLIHGLRQLLEQIGQTTSLPAALRGDQVLPSTDLIQIHRQQVCYCRTDVAKLCETGSFEAVIWLLLNRQAADMEQLADLSSVLSDAASIDQPLVDMIGTVPLQTRPLDLFPLSIALLSCFDPTPADRCLKAAHSQFWRIMAQLPVLFHVAFGGSLTDGRAVEVEDSQSLSYGGRLLQALREDHALPTAVEENAMNAVLICECLTETRPACLLSRFFGSAVNDIVAGLKAASSLFVSQLRNDPFAWVTARLQDFGSPEEAERWWHSRQPRSMPFGFRSAPEEARTAILREQCHALLGSVPAMVLESCAARLEKLMAAQGQYPTTDWMAARVLTLLNVPQDRISLAVGMARLAGWAAHTTEQHSTINSSHSGSR